jgi:uncharacterized membrane protein
MVKQALLWVMGIGYVFAGVLHFVTPDSYLPIMPPWIPAHLTMVYLSGAAEVVLGAAVLEPKLRRVAAWGIIALLIAIFPANVHIAVHNVPVFGAAEGAGSANWVRLPIQALLIVWAWWYTLPDDA